MTITIEKELRIIDDLMEQIISKQFDYGEKLPSENELADKYRVPRTTVRRSLSKLEERGFIYSQRGKGRYLKNESFQVELNLTGKSSFTEKMRQSGHQLVTQNVGCEKIKYDKQIYERLKAAREDTVYQISRLRYIHGEPIAIHNSYINERQFPDIAKVGPEIVSMYSFYRQLGYHDFTNINSLLSVTFPTLNEQTVLLCKSMEPLIMIESTCTDTETAKVLETTKVLYRSDKFKYNLSSR
ncbi:GntR family transcriptional regulator [Gracilibacillus ureilyticus]|uniref:GntR family transcriptional regulator n=1 Tax=Gracilibacillus ureilyticus TaxID=531814 RepID=A0A1H9MQI3_9BACI|nr:GntR family transcriptional regulator [Gracilibacillus ureilyticus]SER25974.1 GntR family transcriptional regulator [Gracilibacillus ureilyticus]